MRIEEKIINIRKLRKLEKLRKARKDTEKIRGPLIKKIKTELRVKRAKVTKVKKQKDWKMGQA